MFITYIVLCYFLPQGMCYGAVKVESVSRSCDKAVEDRFKLSIPYARQSLTWNVFFDSQCPEIGPDFLFYDDTFLADMDIDTISNKVPSLAQWNPNDRNALVNVLIELLSCYKEYQVCYLLVSSLSMLDQNSRVPLIEILPHHEQSLSVIKCKMFFLLY